MAGESTEVASTKRALRGVPNEGVWEELESVRIDLVVTRVSFSSTSREKPTLRVRWGPVVMSTGETGSYPLESAGDLGGITLILSQSVPQRRLLEA